MIDNVKPIRKGLVVGIITNKKIKVPINSAKYSNII